MGKDQFKGNLKKLKMDKILIKFRRQEEKKKRNLEKRLFYFIEDHDAQNPIHYLEPKYEECQEKKKKRLEYLQTIFKFPFEKLKSQSEISKFNLVYFM